MRYKGAETSFALLAMQVLGERCAFHGQGDLRGERLERVDELALRPASRNGGKYAAWLVPHGER